MLLSGRWHPNLKRLHQVKFDIDAHINCIKDRVKIFGADRPVRRISAFLTGETNFLAAFQCRRGANMGPPLTNLRCFPAAQIVSRRCGNMPWTR